MGTAETNKTNNQKLLDWVNEMASLTQPNEIYWCDGSKAEYDDLCTKMLAAGTPAWADLSPP